MLTATTYYTYYFRF